MNKLVPEEAFSSTASLFEGGWSPGAENSFFPVDLTVGLPWAPRMTQNPPEADTQGLSEFPHFSES